MIIAFYSVDSRFERHSFDHFNTTKKEDCLEIVRQLYSMEDSRLYAFGEGVKDFPNEDDFQEDYNNEDLDGGGWWCVALPGLCRKDIDEAQIRLVRISDILWDDDGNADDESLPREIIEAVICKGLSQHELTDKISDMLSDRVGFCHKGFTWEYFTLEYDGY